MNLKNDDDKNNKEEGKDGYAKLEDKVKCASCGGLMRKEDGNIMKCENCGHETSATQDEAK